jgi:hypothetical protein
MKGDEAVRFCDCRLNVYKFSTMTAQEILALLEKNEGRLCGRLLRRRKRPRPVTHGRGWCRLITSRSRERSTCV